MENTRTALELKGYKLQAVLADYKIAGKIVSIESGPTITMFEFEPDRGVKAARIIGLSTDIARCMSAKSARISVTPNSTTIGIELPNTVREIVSLADLLRTKAWAETTKKLPIMLGKDMTGSPVIVDLSSMPHLLIGGTTGSGKSIGIHTIITSLLTRFTSQECRLILVDPKKLEMTHYEGIPHLLTPIITEADDALNALNWAITEMERRYAVMRAVGVRDIAQYNVELATSSAQTPALVRTGFDDDGNEEFGDAHMSTEIMPYIVIVIDEVADIMARAGKDLEAVVQRLAQMSRAAGIHIIMATQRPSVDVITGTIKANFPSRISFQLQSKIDSRTIIGLPGAENLLGNGDMLLLQGNTLTRVQGAFIDTAQIEILVDFRKSQQAESYVTEILNSEIDEEVG